VWLQVLIGIAIATVVAWLVLIGGFRGGSQGTALCHLGAHIVPWVKSNRRDTTSWATSPSNRCSAKA
jgi:hypothetical protein